MCAQLLKQQIATAEEEEEDIEMEAQDSSEGAEPMAHDTSSPAISPAISHADLNPSGMSQLSLASKSPAKAAVRVLRKQKGPVVPDPPTAPMPAPDIDPPVVHDACPAITLMESPSCIAVTE